MSGMNLQPSLARRLLAGALLPALLLGATPALPQGATPRYTVEIIVFRSGNEAALAAGASSSGDGGADVAATPVAPSRLGGAAAKLRSGGGYRVLAHAAWTQGPAAWNSRRGVSVERLGLPGIEGKVILERGQYLHLGVDLTIDDGGKRYRINEVRRVKTDEVQYFDHPAVGVIAVVSGG
jgi:hypothetical protein